MSAFDVVVAFGLYKNGLWNKSESRVIKTPGVTQEPHDTTTQTRMLLCAASVNSMAELRSGARAF